MDYCAVPRSRDEIMNYLGITSRQHLSQYILHPLVEKQLLLLTIPDKPKSKYQKYITNNK